MSKKKQPVVIGEAAGDLSRLIAAADAAHLVFCHYVGVLDQWRPDGWFELQRLAQEGVMRITCIKCQRAREKKKGKAKLAKLF